MLVPVYLPRLKRWVIRRVIRVTTQLANNNYQRADLAKLPLAPFMHKSLPGISDILFPSFSEAWAYHHSITTPHWTLRREEPSEAEWETIRIEERRTEQHVLGGAW